MISTVFDNIRISVRAHPLFYSLFFIMQIVSVNLLLVLFGAYQNNQAQQRNAEEMNKYIAFLMTESESPQKAVKYCFDDIVDGYEDVIDGVAVIASSESGYGAVAEVTFKDGKSVFPESVIESASFMLEGRFPSDEEIARGEKVVWGRSSHISNPVTGMTIDLGGEEFTLVGFPKLEKQGLKGLYISPYAMDENFRAEMVNIYFNRPIRLSEYKVLAARGREAFGEDAQIYDYASIGLDEIAVWRSVSVMTLIMSIVSISIVLISFKYIQKENEKTIAVYRICGASTKQVIVFHILEMGIIVLASMLVGFGLLVIEFKWLSKRMEYFIAAFDTSVTVFMFAAYFLLVMVAVTLMAVKDARITPKELFRKGVRG